MQMPEASTDGAAGHGFPLEELQNFGPGTGRGSSQSFEALAATLGVWMTRHQPPPPHCATCASEQPESLVVHQNSQNSQLHFFSHLPALLCMVACLV